MRLTDEALIDNPLFRPSMAIMRSFTKLERVIALEVVMLEKLPPSQVDIDGSLIFPIQNSL